MSLYDEVPSEPIKLTLSTVSCSVNIKFKANEVGNIFEPNELIPMIKSNYFIKFQIKLT